MPTRTSLRDLAYAALQSVAGVSVFKARALPLPGAGTAGAAPKLPALLLYADRLQREDLASNPGGTCAYTVVTILTVHVVADAASEAALDSALDAISADVESRMLSDDALVSAVDTIAQSQIERAVDMSGERISGQDVHQYALRWTEFV